MAQQTAIEWADVVWNPVTGCDRVSPGCAHCYALELAPRLRAMGVAKYVAAKDGGRSSGPAFGVTLHRDVIGVPYRWEKPRRVFVNSMSDLFHEAVPDGFIAWVFYVMAQNPQHTFQVLTKRPDRMRDFVTRWADNLERDESGELVGLDYVGARGPAEVRAAHRCGRALLFAEMLEQWGDPPEGAAYPTYDWLEGIGRYPSVHHNIWLGVSIENRRFVHRADVLRQCPAAVRFISAEPLLGPLTDGACTCCGATVDHYNLCFDCANDLCPRCATWGDEAKPPPPPTGLSLERIDWLIVGGESGPQHRRIDSAWVRDLRRLARASGTAFFFKQWGGRTPKAGGRELDGRTWDEFPERWA